MEQVVINRMLARGRHSVTEILQSEERNRQVSVIDP